MNQTQQTDALLRAAKIQAEFSRETARAFAVFFGIMSLAGGVMFVAAFFMLGSLYAVKAIGAMMCLWGIWAVVMCVSWHGAADKRVKALGGEKIED